MKFLDELTNSFIIIQENHCDRSSISFHTSNLFHNCPILEHQRSFLRNHLLLVKTLSIFNIEYSKFVTNPLSLHPHPSKEIFIRYTHTHTHTSCSPWPCRPSAQVPPPPFRIPRNFRGRGDWRWRPRALRDKLLHPSAPPTLQARIQPPLPPPRHPCENERRRRKVSEGRRWRSIDLRSSRIRYLYPRGYRNIYIYICISDQTQLPPLPPGV